MDDSSLLVCPLCKDRVSKLLFRFHVQSEQVVIDKIKENNPGWAMEDGICGRCVDHYHSEVVMMQRMLPEVGPYFPVKSPDDFIILPTPIRLDADPRFTGKGITICFIDSGFYPHPDLVATRNRIRLVLDATDNCRVISPDSLKLPAPEEAQETRWHGTMTTVVCAGDGYCSNGLYKGIASDAELVLIKTQAASGRIGTENICSALEWVLNHHREFNIRIVNMSLGDDDPVSLRSSRVDQLAEELVAEGISVVAAVGNDENGSIKPPANALSVISVGGLDDHNSLEDADFGLYHSSWGPTIDGLMKPELVANAIWVAAPILPGTPQKLEAEWIHQALKMDPESLAGNLSTVVEKLSGAGTELFAKNDVTSVREKLIFRSRETKYFSSEYMHVDGTSFAAPIVCSVIAQMLEAEPALTPSQIRHVLFSTARRFPRLPVERQGFGAIHPRKSIFSVLNKGVIMKSHESPFINKRKKTIEFYIQHQCAHQISLSGTFNHWAQDVLLMEPGKNGMWKITIPMLPQGKYYYKFFVDDRMWVEDVDNPYREPDGFNGWNSVLMIEN